MGDEGRFADKFVLIRQKYNLGYLVDPGQHTLGMVIFHPGD
jgi:hypothetical protein